MTSLSAQAFPIPWLVPGLHFGGVSAGQLLLLLHSSGSLSPPQPENREFGQLLNGI